MIRDSVRWGPMVAGCVAVLATLTILGVLGSGQWPQGSESFGFALLLGCAVIASWLIAGFMRAHWHRVVALMPRLIRFGTVGVMNTLVDLGILNLLLYLFASGDTHTRLFPVFATLSFVGGTLNSFYWNRKWTFRSDGGTKHALSKFYAVTTMSFVINVGISTLLVWLNPFPFLSPTLWANIAKLVATGVSMVLNFVGYQRIVFTERA